MSSTNNDQPDRVVDVFADVSCPFAHYSLRRFTERRRLAGAGHVRLRVHAWPLELANGEPLEVGKVTDEIADLRAQVAGDLFVGSDSFFCPTLDIERQGERLRIAIDDAELDRFLDDALS